MYYCNRSSPTLNTELELALLNQFQLVWPAKICTQRSSGRKKAWYYGWFWFWKSGGLKEDLIKVRKLLPDLWSKQLLVIIIFCFICSSLLEIWFIKNNFVKVHFFLKHREEHPSDVGFRLTSWILGLCVLAVLSLSWQQRWSSLYKNPHWYSNFFRWGNF